MLGSINCERFIAMLTERFPSWTPQQSGIDPSSVDSFSTATQPKSEAFS